MKANKMNGPNQGVKCIVTNCHYYMQGDHCSAEKIEIKPSNARETEETDCGTFIPEARL